MEATWTESELDIDDEEGEFAEGGGTESSVFGTLPFFFFFFADDEDDECCRISGMICNLTAVADDESDSGKVVNFGHEHIPQIWIRHVIVRPFCVGRTAHEHVCRLKFFGTY
jgi:hypothetical protein